MQQPGQIGDVMAVHRTNVVKAQVLKKCTGQNGPLDGLFDPVGQIVHLSAPAHGLQNMAVFILEFQIPGFQMLRASKVAIPPTFFLMLMPLSFRMTNSFSPLSPASESPHRPGRR